MKIEVKDLYQHLGKTLYIYFKERNFKINCMEESCATGQLVFIGKDELKLNLISSLFYIKIDEIIAIFDNLEEFSAYMMYLNSPS